MMGATRGGVLGIRYDTPFRYGLDRVFRDAQATICGRCMEETGCPKKAHTGDDDCLCTPQFGALRRELKETEFLIAGTMGDIGPEFFVIE